MARIDTLGHFLTDVADAIRTKTGSSDTIAAEDFDTEIENIPSGGGAIKESDVNFYDYDGTLTNSYTKSDFLALSEMPANPTHSGLTSQGWNWSLANAKDYINTHAKLNIGQHYITDDSKTRVYVNVAEGKLSFYMAFAIKGTATIDWGDGTTDTVTGYNTSTAINTQHTYPSVGDYVITLDGSDTIYLLGTERGSYLFKDTNTYPTDNTIGFTDCITKIELGDVKMTTGAFCRCRSLTSIAIPKDSMTSVQNVFKECVGLRSVVIPSGLVTISNSFFNGCVSLQNVILPSDITTIGTSCFEGCTSLSNLTLPSGTINFNGDCFRYCSNLRQIELAHGSVLNNACFRTLRGLRYIRIPNGITSIGSYAFSECNGLTKVVFPNTLTNVGGYSFAYCPAMGCYDFSNCEQIPTLNAHAMDGIHSSCKIVVPDDLYEDWIAATTWSSYANYIIKKSDWDNL